MASSVIRRKLEAKEFFVAPGLQDGIAAMIANRVGFDVIYGTGFWSTASAYGLPDAGIATYTQMLERMSMLARISNGALIADADTGYGGPLNVHHTVRGYEAAGVSVLQLEDQQFPKKCGHTPYKRMISSEDMVTKIQVACAARTDRKNFLIVARTDARQSEGLVGVLRRLEAYEKAGADILFPEALIDEEEMRKTCEAFGKPVLANMSDGGHSPILSAATLREIGFAFAIYPSMTSLAAAAAMERALSALKHRGTSQDEPLFDFNTFCRLIGFEEVWAFEKKWGKE